MTLEEAMKWADTFGSLQCYPPDGDAPALMALAAEVRRLSGSPQTEREATSINDMAHEIWAMSQGPQAIEDSVIQIIEKLENFAADIKTAGREACALAREAELIGRTGG